MIRAGKFRALTCLLILMNGCSYQPPAIINDVEIVDDGISNKTKAEESDLWNSNFKINNDYIGTIIFDSGLLNVDVVQGKTDNDYIRTNWETMSYDRFGSICLSADNTLEDQNILIFGHTVYRSVDPSGSAMLTPLHQLKENFEDNSSFKFILGNETRIYQVAYVYDCELLQENGSYFAPAGLNYNGKYYSSDELVSYQENIKLTDHTDAGITLNEDDKLLTFQTCEEGNKLSRLIVVSKLIKTYTR